MVKLKIINASFILFVALLFFIASCAKIQQNTNEDLEFKKMCQDAGYDWMLMNPTKDGKIIQDAKACMGCMVEGIEHICDKRKFMEITGKNSAYQPSADLKTIPEKIKTTGAATLTLNFRNSEGKPLNLEVKPEYIVKLNNIRKEKGISFKNIDELRQIIEK